MSDFRRIDDIVYTFSDVTVDSANFSVHKAGEKVVLSPRAFDVLILLLQNRDRVVEKQEIFERIWKDTFVSDNALTKVVKELRHALGDQAHEPALIETLPKRGYRFIAPVVVGSDQIEPPSKEGPRRGPADAISRHQPTAAKTKVVLAVVVIAITVIAGWYFYRRPQAIPPSAIRSIAVLPFKPLNNDSRDESFELGMAEALIIRLSNLKQVIVRPINSVRKYTDPNFDPVQAGREVQVQSILDGSVQRAGDRIRVTARLIDVETGAALWSDQFDEDITDIFKVQDSIAERIANAFAIELNRSEREQITKRYTKDPEAYELYLQAQLIWHRRTPNWINQSLDLYQQALSKDPNFALAYVGLQRCYFALASNRILPMSEAEAKAKPALVKALQLDGSLAEAHNALAEFKYQFEYDWSGAETEFKKAIELNPNVSIIRLAYGWFLMSQGRFDEAGVQVEMARSLDPSSLAVSVARGKFLYYTRQYDLALQQFQNVLALTPNDVGAHFFLFTIYEEKKMYDDANESLLRFMGMSGQQPSETIEELRRVYQTSGREAFYRKLLEILHAQSQTKNIEPYRFAAVNIRLGERDQAFEWLEKTFEGRDPSIIQFKIDPANDGLRDDPRFARLARKIGLEP